MRQRRSSLRFRRSRKRRSEEHTSELQSPCNIVCRLLLEKKQNGNLIAIYDPLTTRQLPNGTYTRDPFPGNIIPANRMSTVARKMVKDWPRADAQVSGANGLSNYFF